MILLKFSSFISKKTKTEKKIEINLKLFPGSHLFAEFAVFGLVGCLHRWPKITPTIINLNFIPTNDEG